LYKEEEALMYDISHGPPPLIFMPEIQFPNEFVDISLILLDYFNIIMVKRDRKYE
jgi:hypothetical protein